MSRCRGGNGGGVGHGVERDVRGGAGWDGKDLEGIGCMFGMGGI